MGDILLMVLLVSVVAIVIGGSVFWSQKVSDAWQEAAGRLGLEFAGGSFMIDPTIRGELRGVSIEVLLHRRRRGTGKNRRTQYFTEFNAYLAPDWMCGMRITERGFTDKVVEFFGGEDIAIGHDGFDEEFRVRGSVSDKAKEALRQTGPRAALQRLVNTFNQFEVDGERIQTRMKGRISNANAMTRHISAVVDAADELNDAIVANTSSDAEDDDVPELFPSPTTVDSPDNQGAEKEDLGDAVW